MADQKGYHMITYVHPTMRTDFIRKVLRNGGLDTRNYRYSVKHDTDVFHLRTRILRLPIKALDTTAALAPWECVWQEVNYDGGKSFEQIAKED